MKAREWLERSKQAVDPIEALSNIWRGFNNLYYPLGGGSEPQKIRRYLQTKVDEAAAQQVLHSHTEEVTYLLSQPVIDMRGNGKDTSTNIASFNSATSSVAKLEEVFMVIYQVRCNLEHGQKSPSRDRDVRLCECAGPILVAVVQRDA